MEFGNEKIIITEEKVYKTSEARRRASKRYEEYIERINPSFPPGTKERIQKLGFQCGTFVKLAVEEKLQALEKEQENATKNIS